MNNNLPFSLNDIIELATDNSFDRGEAYYNNRYVRKITRIENKFEGIVTGTRKYNVTLDIKNDELYFYCSCPYYHGGICKHEVAFALAILNGEYEDKQEVITSTKINPEEFRECFKNTDTQKKLSFLKQLLDKDTDLQNQFLAFTKSRSENLDSITGIDIDSIKEEVHNDLSSIDFDYAVENYDSYNGGYYDDDGYIDAAYDEIKDIFSPYKDKAIEYIRKGNLLDAFRIVLGLYEGSQNLPEPESDVYDIFYENYSDVVLDLLIEEFNDITSEVEQIVKSDEIIIQVIDLIIQRFNYYESLYAKIEKNDDAEFASYNLKKFEGLFISLITNKETANYFFTIIQKNDLECLNMAFVLLKIAEITENEELWINTAEEFAEFEQEITKQLLEKYKQKNEEKNFNKIAESAFNKWPDSFDLYLINSLNKETKKTLFIETLKNYTAHKQSIKHYKELKGYLNEGQRKEFVDKIGEGYHSVFYVQLLDIEKRYPDILSFVKKQQDSIYDFEKIIAPIRNIYPDECFDVIETKCTAAMNAYKRNRKTYQQMVKWLKVMSQISSKQKETKQFIKSLYEYKPNLPALKDEIRKAALN